MPILHNDIAWLGSLLAARRLYLATAESCTGGLLAASITDVPGASGWYAGGVVAYANEVKTALLGVPTQLFIDHGAVSQPVVLAMAAGACRSLGCGAAVAVSGIAGPGGGTPEKPVGTVWIGWQVADVAWASRFLFPGDRNAVRQASVRAAIQGLLDHLS